MTEKQREKDRQIQSLIRQFKSNELEYEDQICSLMSRNRILQIQVQELNTYINMHQIKPKQEESMSERRYQLSNNLQQISHRILAAVQSNYECIINSLNTKITHLIHRLNNCLLMIQKKNQLNSPTQITQILQLQKQLTYKTNYISTQNQLIDKIINEKSQSQAIFNRQFIFLERLANDKKELCNRLESMNTYLIEQNTELKRQREKQRERERQRVDISRNSTQKLTGYEQQQGNIRLNDRFNRTQKLKQQINSLFAPDLKTEQKSRVKQNGSKPKISLYVDRKMLKSKEKINERQKQKQKQRQKQKHSQNEHPFSDIGNDIDFYYRR